MTISLESIPSFSAAEALAAANRNYGLTGTVSALPSERDQNFLITDARGCKFVLKIANSSDSPQLLDFQNRAMRQVEQPLADCRVPQVLSSPSGLHITDIHRAGTGARHCVRLLTWIEGGVLAKSATRTASLFDSIGGCMARMDAALRDFSHPAMHRTLQWDLRHADLAREYTGLLPHARRSYVERLFAQWERIDWTRLRHSVIHGDANDHNIIVADGRMVGLLDFGDMVYTATVCDLAIALAYTMLGAEEPLSVAAQVVRAYQRHFPLTEAEQAALFPLMLSRLSMSVCYSAHNRARNPDDPYQVVSETAVWNLLAKLERCEAEATIDSMRGAAPPDADP
jgi:Ser/Thr protein kinase RdoA (MazF antagonist)